MQVVATAGHVDHGKSTLLRALTGMEPDRWEEERRRGLTIDLGFVWTDLGGPAGADDLESGHPHTASRAPAPAGAGSDEHTGPEVGAAAGTDREGSGEGPAGGGPAGDDASVTVAFVDVPGHERFVPNMLAGAGAVALSLFVVAADDGWSAQSEEHLAILDLLGVAGAVVAVTKRDLAGEDRTAEVVAQVTTRLAGTSLAGAPVLAVDSVTGHGIGALREVLLARLRASDPATDRRRARLWVDRSFTIGGAGTVVTGTLAGGRLRVGDEVTLLPGGVTARIRGLHALGAAVPEAPPGSRVAVNLAGIAHDDVQRGDALVAVTAGAARTVWVVTDTVDAVVRVLPGQHVDRPGAWHLHVGSAETTCTVHPLLGEAVTDRSEGYVRLVLERRLPLRSGDRFVLREAGRRATVAGGQVLDPRPPGRVRGPDARLARASELDAIHAAGAGLDRLAPLVAAWGGARRRDAALAAADLPLDTELPAGLTRVRDWLVTDDALRRWGAAIGAAVDAHHRDHPSSPGPDRVHLASAASSAGTPKALADELPDHLVATGDLRRHGPSYAQPDHAPAQREARAAGVEALLARLEAEPFSPPDLKTTAAELGVTFPVLQQLQQSGRIVRAGDIGFARPAVDRAVTELRALQAKQGPFTASQARERLGTSRKYAIPLLEYLDGVGATRFDGQHRTVSDPSPR